MRVQLIPLLEIYHTSKVYESPTVFPYWQYPREWSIYQRNTLSEAGYRRDMISYLAGSAFYELSSIIDQDLIKLIIRHTGDYRAGVYDREMVSPLFGGYALNVDGEDKFFPQCCGDLSDIYFWEALAQKRVAPYEGHPVPGFTFRGENVLADFTVGEHDEHFQPTPPDKFLSLPIKELSEAVECAKQDLLRFSDRLRRINTETGLQIDAIDQLLIWGSR